jgi:peptide/nickel transport system substrate-binding protein
MKRRSLLAAGVAALATPRIGNAQAARPLRFAPVADLAALDPVWTSARPTRNHAFLVFDMLYGVRRFRSSLGGAPAEARGHSDRQAHDPFAGRT